MVKQLFIALTSIALVPALALANSTEVNDIQGWNQTYWGMSSAAFKEQLPNAQPVSDIHCLKTDAYQRGKIDCQGVTQYIVKGIQIGNYIYDLNFEFKDGSLRLVFSFKEDKQAQSAYYDLVERLRDKYGKPSKTFTVLPGEQWKLPSTEIFVGLTPALHSNKTPSLILNYQPRRASDPNL